MAIERCVAIYVNDEVQYQKYREGMYPILKRIGGDFGYDFKIAEVLKSETEEPINRVFTINFQDENSMNDFFSNEEYLQVKEKYFKGSVSTVTEIARYEK